MKLKDKEWEVKTASIKEAECQEQVKRIFKFIESRRDTCQLNAEQIDCRLCLSELLEALGKLLKSGRD